MTGVVFFPLMFALVSGAAPATSTLKLAAPEWTAAQVDRDLAAFFSDELARALRSRGLQVVTAADMAAVLGAERQRQLLGCDESGASCLLELGNALGCDGLLRVSLAKLSGGAWRANVKVLSSRDGTTLAETGVESDSDQAFARALDPAAERLARALAPPGAPPDVPEAKGASSPRRVAWIPAVAGGLVSLAGGALLGLAVWRSSSLDQELSSQGRVTDTAVRLAREGKAFEASGWVGLGVGLAALAVAGVMALWGAEAPLRPEVSLSPHGAAVGLTLVWP